MGEGGTLYVNTGENPLYSELVIRDTGRGSSRKICPGCLTGFIKAGILLPRA